MAKVTLFDNDAVLKLSAYACWGDLQQTPYLPPAVLKVATYSLASQARKARRVQAIEPFRERLAAFLKSCTVLEPDEDEIALATDLEERAQGADEEFDTGESQLVAVLVTRLIPLLVTGDKRALGALQALNYAEANGRLLCIEQLLRKIVADGDWASLRSRVCAERKVDTAISMAFGCHSEPTHEHILEGLDSYINDARRKAGTLLAE